MTSFISMLGHLGGIGVFILATLDSSCAAHIRAAGALTIVLAAVASRTVALLRHVQHIRLGLGASIAYHLSHLGFLYRLLRERYLIEPLHSYIVSEAARCCLLHLPSYLFRLPFCNWCWRNALSLYCVCTVFWHGTGMSLCSTGSTSHLYWETVGDKHVVGAHADTSSGFFLFAV